MKDNGGNNLQ